MPHLMPTRVALKEYKKLRREKTKYFYFERHVFLWQIARRRDKCSVFFLHYITWMGRRLYLFLLALFHKIRTLYLATLCEAFRREKKSSFFFRENCALFRTTFKNDRNYLHLQCTAVVESNITVVMKQKTIPGCDFAPKTPPGYHFTQLIFRFFSPDFFSN